MVYLARDQVQEEIVTFKNSQKEMRSKFPNGFQKKWIQFLMMNHMTNIKKIGMQIMIMKNKLNLNLLKDQMILMRLMKIIIRDLWKLFH